MVDSPVARFIMSGARAAIADGMPHIEEQVIGIEHAVAESPGLAFDLAKTLIESVCRTVLTERSISFDSGDDLPKLFRTATNSLPFLPESASGEADVRKSLVRTLSGLHTAVQGVCELRNQCGFASHGGDSPRPAMESVQALLAAEAADAIVGFLHRVHRLEGVSPARSTLTYDSNPAFNEHLDEIFERVRIFEEEFEPSRVLFELAPEPYRIYLAEFEQEAAGEQIAARDEGTGEAVP